MTLIAIADRHSRGTAAEYQFRTRRFACGASSHFASDSRFAKVRAGRLNEQGWMAFIFSRKTSRFPERAKSAVDGTMDALPFGERDFTDPFNKGS